VAEPPAPAREEDLREGVTEAIEGGEPDDRRCEQCRRADLRRGDPREPQVGAIPLQVVDEITDRVRLEHRGDCLDHEHHEGQDEPPAVTLREPEQEPRDATIAAASVCLRHQLDPPASAERRQRRASFTNLPGTRDRKLRAKARCAFRRSANAWYQTARCRKSASTSAL